MTPEIMRTEIGSKQEPSEYVRSHESPGKSEWLILYCQPNKEWYAARQLEERGIGTFIPWYHLLYRGKNIKRNLLRNYFFIRSEKIDDLRLFVKAIHGVKNLVLDGEEEARVPNDVVNAIKGRLNKINTTEAISFPLHEGNQVEEVEGSTIDLKWVFGEGCSPKDRVLATLDVGKQFMFNAQASQVRRVI